MYDFADPRFSAYPKLFILQWPPKTQHLSHLAGPLNEPINLKSKSLDELPVGFQGLHRSIVSSPRSRGLFNANIDRCQQQKSLETITVEEEICSKPEPTCGSRGRYQQFVIWVPWTVPRLGSLVLRNEVKVGPAVDLWLCP